MTAKIKSVRVEWHEGWVPTFVVETDNGNKPDGFVADAAHIVRCVNAHDDLVAALRYVEARLAYVAVPSGQPDVSRAFVDLRDAARVALAKVEAP